MTITTENQVSTVLGDITAADVDKINTANAMAIDLTKVRTIAAGVNITPLHENAIIIVKGTANDNTPNSKYDAIKDMKNVVVLGTDGWYRPVNQLVMTDIPGEPLWKGEGINKEWISTEKIGWKFYTSFSSYVYFPPAMITISSLLRICSFLNLLLVVFVIYILAKYNLQLFALYFLKKYF